MSNGILTANHGHDHSHDHGHSHEHGGPPSPGWSRRLAIGALLIVLVLVGTVAFTVRAGSAVVVTRLGAPARVLVEPGLAFKFPAPLERTLTVDLRTRTTSTGLHGVLTRDGLSIVVQASTTWRVAADREQVLRFVRAGNDPVQAAEQLRGALSSAVETASGRFSLGELVNPDPAQVRLAAFEQALQEALVGNQLGVEVVQVAVERLALPPATVAATVQRMSEERKTAAERVMAEGRRQAGAIRADAERDARIARALANEDAARVEAEAKAGAAKVYGEAYTKDPALYAWLRGLDTIATALPAGSRLILRTDAEPLRALVEGPPVRTPAADAPAAPAP